MKKIEKILKEMADKDLEKYKDDDFLQELLAIQKENQKKHGRKLPPIKKLRITVLSLCVIIIGLIIGLSCALVLRPAKVTYIYSDFREESSNSQSLNESLSAVSYKGNGDCKCFRMQDDTIVAYGVKELFGNTVDEIAVYFIVRQDILDIKKEFPLSREFLGFDCFYNSETTFIEEGGLYSTAARGYFDTGAETVFFVYSVVGLQDGSSVFERLGEIIELKR